MRKNTTKIEQKAIHILETPIVDCDYLDKNINSMDKELSWDGYLYLYKEKVFSHKSFDFKIPIQVKGHLDENEKEINRNMIQYALDLDTLKNYYCDNGVLYFRVLISEKRAEIFYNILYPSKIKTVLEEAAKKKNKKSITITFTKLKPSASEMMRICKQFAFESRKQGSGLGQIVPKSVRIDNLFDIKRLTATAIGAANTREFLQRIKDGDVCFYAKKDESDIEYPVQMIKGAKFVVEEYVNHKVSINNICFYEKYMVLSDTDGGELIKLSKNLTFNFEHMKFNIKRIGTLEELANDANFLLALTNSQSMEIASHPIKYSDPKLHDGLEENLHFIIGLYDIFNQLNIKLHNQFNSFTDSDITYLMRLYDIYTGKLKLEQEVLYTFNFKIGEKVFPILVCKSKEDEIRFVNRIYEGRYQGYINIDDSHYKVPLYCDLKPEIIANLYLYDYSELYHQIDISDINEDTLDTFNMFILTLISAYDISHNGKLLEFGDYIIQKLLAVNEEHYYLTINRCQIRERQGLMSEEDKQKLKNIIDKETENGLLCGAYMLLGEKVKAKACYSEMSDIEKEAFSQFPIFRYMEV